MKKSTWSRVCLRKAFSMCQSHRGKVRLACNRFEERTLPTTFIVTNINDSGAGSLRQGVLDANALGGADTIVFDAAVFKTAQTITLTTGELQITDPVVLSGTETGSAKPTISAGGASRIFDIIYGASIESRVVGLVISGGTAGTGGGIRIQNCPVELSACTVTGNMATIGGGIFVENGSLELANSLVTGNTVKLSKDATGSSYNNSSVIGGGIYVRDGYLTLSDSTVSVNTALAENKNAPDFSINIAKAQGGGIFCSAVKVTVINTLVSGNSASAINTAGRYGTNKTYADGAGIVFAGSTVTLTSTTISANTAFAGNTSGKGSASNPVTNSASASGGGIHVVGEAITATNCIVSGNTATAQNNKNTSGYFPDQTINTCSVRGAGISCTDATLTLAQGLISGNKADATNQSGFSSNNTASAAGGGIHFGFATFATKALIVNDSEVSKNDAGAENFTQGTSMKTRTGSGGGIYIGSQGDATISRTRIVDDNCATTAGGGIYSSGAISIADSEISGNLTTVAIGLFEGNGGGMWLRGFSTIQNCTISGNLAARNGGGIYFGDHPAGPAIFNSTIAFNGCNVLANATIKGGGGIGLLNEGSVSGVVLGLDSSVVANNKSYLNLPPEPDDIVTGTKGEIGAVRSLVGNKATETYASDVENIFNVDPLLKALAFNGGPTRTHALTYDPAHPLEPAFTSAAIDAGQNKLMLVSDQRGPGHQREVKWLPTTPEKRADMGAFEVQLPTVVKVVVHAADQRSIVPSVSVIFSEPVSFTGAIPDAVTLFRDLAIFEQLNEGDQGKGFVNLKAIQNGDVVTLTFLDTGTASKPIHATNIGSGSLPDGLYTLTAKASEIKGLYGNLDGDGDGTTGGDYVLVGDPGTVPNLFRLFGDSDGDGDVDASDFLAFRNASGTSKGDPNYNSVFDYDNDGDVDAQDFLQFRDRFGYSFP